MDRPDIDFLERMTRTNGGMSKDNALALIEWVRALEAERDAAVETLRALGLRRELSRVAIGNKTPQEVVQTEVFNIFTHRGGAIWGEIEVDGMRFGVMLVQGAWMARAGEPIPERFR